MSKPRTRANGHPRSAVRVDLLAFNQKDEELRKLNRTLRAIRNGYHALMEARDEDTFAHKVCDIIVRDCGYATAWLTIVDEDGSLRSAVRAFDEKSYQTVGEAWDHSELKAAVERAVAERSTVVTFGGTGLKSPLRSCLSIPLLNDDKALGGLTICSTDENPFSPEEMEMLNDLAQDVVFGIRTLRLLAKDREDRKRDEAILKRDKETFERLVEERTEALVETQIELEKAKRLSDIGTLAATVAHELRNPLAAISMAAANIQRKIADSSITRHINNIEKKVIESDQIINNLLFYSRIRPPEYQTISLRNVIDECVGIAQVQSHKRVTINVNLTMPDDYIEADAYQIREILTNLINNAYDAVSEKDGCIEIKGAADGNFVLVTISDNGCGIEKEDLKRIYDPFFTTKAKGTGLGLTVCRQIMNMHGGRLGIRSEPGKGTSIHLSLPKSRKRNKV